MSQSFELVANQFQKIGRWCKDRRKGLRARVRTYAATRNRRKSAATVVAITGSSGKSTATLLLSHILAAEGGVQTLYQPLQVREIVKSLRGLRRKTEFYVAELSVGKKGHLKQMLEMIRPDVGIVTFVGLEHYKVYRTRAGVADEKALLPGSLPDAGLAILNSDDDLVLAMSNKTSARVVTFGRGMSADYRATNISSAYPANLSLSIEWKGRAIDLATPFVGEHFWLSVAAAFTAAVELGVSPDVVKERIASFKPLPDRCQPFPTREGPTFLLDTFKAPWQTLGLAFETLAKADAPRKRIVLGMLSDYPGNPVPKYRDAYQNARAVADQVIFIGDHAHRSRASEEDVATRRFMQAHSVKSIYEHLKQTAQSNELILLKGSRNLHLERVALAFEHDVQCWKEHCGLHVSCFECGLYLYPFEEHKRFKQRK